MKPKRRAERQPTKRGTRSQKKRNVKRRHRNPQFQRGAVSLQAPLLKESKRGRQRVCREAVFTEAAAKMGYLSIKTHSANLSLRERSKGGVASSEGAAPSPRRTDVRGASAVIGANPPPGVFFERDTCAIHQREPK